MQETLRTRIEQLRNQEKQGQGMLTNISNEILMIKGAIAEATAMLNHLIEEEKKAADAKALEEANKAKEAAKKSKAKSRKKAAPKAVEENVPQPLAA